MFTAGRVLIANVGEPVQMECQFSSEDFNLFDNPMQWQKRQFFDDHQINMMGNILEPFVSTKRFQTSFEQIPPLYMLSLNLSSRCELVVYICLKNIGIFKKFARLFPLFQFKIIKI